LGSVTFDGNLKTSPASGLDTSFYLSNIDIIPEEQGLLAPCDIYLNLCPAGKK